MCYVCVADGYITSHVMLKLSFCCLIEFAVHIYLYKPCYFKGHSNTWVCFQARKLLVGGCYKKLGPLNKYHFYTQIIFSDGVCSGGLSSQGKKDARW